jgi:hypothetical protein
MRSLALIYLHGVYSPVSVKLASEPQQIVIELQKLHSVRCAEVSALIGFALKSNSNLEGVGCVNPFEWSNHGAGESPIIHFLSWIVTAMEKPKIEPWTLRFFAIDRQGFR